MLTVIVVSYNTRDLLRECLASVLAGLDRSDLDGQVWVVDNASSDGSPEMVRQEFPDAHLIANTGNRGFAAANNQVLRALGLGEKQATASPDAVLLLNPDTLIQGDAMGLLYRTLISDSAAGVAGANLTYADGSFQHGAFHFPDLFQVLFDFFPIHHRIADSRLNGRYARRLFDRGKPFPIDHPLGAALMARWEAIKQVGPMDERFFMYCEEIDWCMRFKQNGWRVLCVPEARIVHYAGQSARQFRDKMFVALWKSRFLLFRKHYPAVFRRSVRFLVSLGMRRKVSQARVALARGEIDISEVAQVERARDRIVELSKQ